MKTFDIKKKLRSQQVTVGSWITIGNPIIGEIMANMGFDWLTIDMEHSAITISEAQQLIQVIELAGVVPLVRVGDNNPLLIKRAMDAGAHGVIVPMVNSKDNAVKAVESVKYPPIGIRGVGLGRTQGYGFTFDEYKNWVNDGSIVIVQIEHIDAINNLDEILGVEGVDGSIIGPYDLSGSLGVPGEFQDSRVLNAIEYYETTCHKLEKPAGFHIVKPDAEAANYYKKQGYSFLAVGLDTLYLGQKCKDVLEQITR
ncbi:4-hydroxy-2-oxovalerate aldolase [Candidatus Magnetobacterium bavaricum]|uniref:4-hydroxy-2-oxovalerate aldolase n=1 Tax=Candidatus Magnetobacterium bavaricum TaxID=29290 RepID=A0A0F3GHN6_9BACT|nr:4-hydroxy-2-oxovalerate aldolase [Candidatus Magnetobacterium bavaricum]